MPSSRAGYDLIDRQCQLFYAPDEGNKLCMVFSDHLSREQLEDVRYFLQKAYRLHDRDLPLGNAQVQHRTRRNNTRRVRTTAVSFILHEPKSIHPIATLAQVLAHAMEITFGNDKPDRKPGRHLTYAQYPQAIPTPAP